MDPAEQVASPYDFCGGDPVANVDPDGRSFGSWLHSNEQTVTNVSLAVGLVALFVATGGGATPAMIAVLAGAVAAGYNANMAGTSREKAFQVGLVGAAVGAATLGLSNAMPAQGMAQNVLIAAAMGSGAAVTQGGFTNLIMGQSFDHDIMKTAVVGAGIGAGFSLLGYLLNAMQRTVGENNDGKPDAETRASNDVAPDNAVCSSDPKCVVLLPEDPPIRTITTKEIIITAKPNPSVLDNFQTAVDLIGFGDPSGAADALNAVIYAARGQWVNAGISALAIVAIGDVLKVGRLANKAHTVYQAVDKAGTVRYVGITSRSLAKREAEHKVKKEFKNLDFIE